MLQNQSLIGEGVALVVNSNTLRAAGTKPTVTDTASSAPKDVVVINSGNTIKGVALATTANQTTGALITGSPAGLTFTDSTATLVTTSTARGINLTGGS